VVFEFLLVFRQMSDSDQAQKSHFVNITACIDSHEKVSSERGDSFDNLNVEPAQIHAFEQNQATELLIDLLRKSLHR